MGSILVIGSIRGRIAQYGFWNFLLLVVWMQSEYVYAVKHSLLKVTGWHLAFLRGKKKTKQILVGSFSLEQWPWAPWWQQSSGKEAVVLLPSFNKTYKILFFMLPSITSLCFCFYGSWHWMNYIHEPIWKTLVISN